MHELAQCLVLLVLVGQIGPVHEHEFGAQQADADSAGFERRVNVARQFHIGMQSDGRAVAGDSRHIAQ